MPKNRLSEPMILGLMSSGKVSFAFVCNVYFKWLLQYDAFTKYKGQHNGPLFRNRFSVNLFLYKYLERPFENSCISESLDSLTVLNLWLTLSFSTITLPLLLEPSYLRFFSLDVPFSTFSSLLNSGHGLCFQSCSVAYVGRLQQQLSVDDADGTI